MSISLHYDILFFFNKKIDLFFKLYSALQFSSFIHMIFHDPIKTPLPPPASCPSPPPSPLVCSLLSVSLHFCFIH